MNNTTALLPHLKLRFNIEHPSFEDCYAFGYECAAQDLAESDNPFAIGSEEAEQWADGWWAGFYGEQPLFELEKDAVEDLSVNKTSASNDKLYVQKHSFLTLVFEISGAIAASALVGYQIFELVA